MNIPTTPGLELNSVQQVNDTYLFRITVTAEQDSVWQDLRRCFQEDTVPDDFPGIRYVSVSKETETTDDRYSATIAVKPPPGFWQLDSAFEQLVKAWQTAIAEEGSADSRQTVINAFHVAVQTMGQYHEDITNAPEFDDTPEGIIDMFEYIHSAVQEEQENNNG